MKNRYSKETTDKDRENPAIWNPQGKRKTVRNSSGSK